MASLVVFGLLACRGGEEGKAAAPGVEAWGLADAGSESGGSAACDTVLVLCIDKVLREELYARTFGGAAHATPHIDSLLAGAMRAEDALTTSTAGNSAMASLLTGRHGVEHGVLSLRDGRRQKLPESELTLAEGFQAAGWTTIYSSGSPLHARGLSGFRQGFDHYEAPRPSEQTRPAAGVGNGALQPLRRALDADERAFVMLSFDDLTARSLRPPSPEIAAPFVRARLLPIARERADVEAALRTMERDPAKGIDELTQRLARARGSRASNAWKMALRDAHLSVIDAAVGEVLAAIEASGRAQRTLVALAGLRGTLPPGYRPEAGPLFTASAVQIPLAVRFPNGLRRGEAFGATASLLDVSRVLAEAGGFELGATEWAGAGAAGWGGAGGSAESSAESSAGGGAYVCDARRKVLAFIDGEAQIERYHTGKVIAFDRQGRQSRLDEAALAPRHGALAGFIESLTANDVTVAVSEGSRGVEVAYEVSPGGAVEIGGERSKPKVRGLVALAKGASDPAALGLRLDERVASVRLRLTSTDGSDLGPGDLSLGETSAASLPVLFAPLEAGPGGKADPSTDPSTDPNAEAAGLRIERADGLWWTLYVAGDAGAGEGGDEETEVLLSIWPPREATDELEVSPDPGMQWSPVPGRLDLVHIHGVAPFQCRIKKLGKEEFTVACRTPIGFLPPTEMEFFGERFAGPSAMAFVVPDHQKAVSAGMLSLEKALYGPGGAATSADAARIRVGRTGIGPPPEAFEPVDVSDLDELARLVPGE